VLQRHPSKSRKVHCAPLSTLPLVRDGMISWPEELGR
jgi:hypothetical protein